MKRDLKQERHENLFRALDIKKDEDVVVLDDLTRTEDGKKETEEIKEAVKAISSGGRLAIAFKNRFSMRNFSGADKDHSFTNEKTFSLKDMKERLNAAGIKDEDIETFYPYPDHLYPMTIFSDEYLPAVGELYKGEYIERNDICFFDDIKAYDEVIKEGMFPFFSPSYLLVCRIKNEK